MDCKGELVVISNGWGDGVSYVHWCRPGYLEHEVYPVQVQYRDARLSAHVPMTYNAYKRMVRDLKKQGAWTYGRLFNAAAIHEQLKGTGDEQSSNDEKLRRCGQALRRHSPVQRELPCLLG